MRRFLPILLAACMTAAAAPIAIIGAPTRLYVSTGSGGDPDPGGGDEPASGHVGYNNATESMTASRLTIDGRIDLVSTGFEALRAAGDQPDSTVREATLTHVASGGFWGSGFLRCTPGHYISAMGEQYCGIGPINNIDSAGDATRVTLGMMLRFGADFWDDQPSDIKLLIMHRGENASRPMIISKNGGITRVLGACDGTGCNVNNTPEDPDYFNEGNLQPDIEDFNGQWVWVEWQYDGIDNELRTKLWTYGGEFVGATVSRAMESSNGEEITSLDIIGYIRSVETLSAASYYDIQWVDIQLGSDADLTPPEGFPGSAR